VIGPSSLDSRENNVLLWGCCRARRACFGPPLIDAAAHLPARGYRQSALAQVSRSAVSSIDVRRCGPPPRCARACMARLVLCRSMGAAVKRPHVPI
jgi:hypothetical protein